MPTECTERAGRNSSAPSNRSRPSNPRRRERKVSATSSDANTVVSRTSQAIDGQPTVEAWSLWKHSNGSCTSSIDRWHLRPR